MKNMFVQIFVAGLFCLSSDVETEVHPWHSLKELSPSMTNHFRWQP